MQANTEKCYEVTLTTDQPLLNGEDFWMYRIFDDKEEALKAANTLRSFFPYYKYPSKVVVKEFDLFDKSMQKERVIYNLSLEDQDGNLVTRETAAKKDY